MSYGGPGAWDGGPPGAEADYANSRPATDPWTGAHYYDYRYNYPGYYPPTTSEQYYGGNYPNTNAYAAQQVSNYNNFKNQSQSKPSVGKQIKSEYRQSSRSPVRDKRRGSNYDDDRQRRSRNYSSSDRSSDRSRSRSHSAEKDKYTSDSSASSSSDRSHGKYRMRDRSPSPPYRGRKSRSRGKDRYRRSPARDARRRRSPHTPSGSPEKERLQKDKKSHSDNKPENEHKNRKSGRSVTPYKRSSRSVTPPRSYKQSSSKRHKDSSKSISPPESYLPHRSKSSSEESDHSSTPLRRSRSASKPRRRSRSRSRRQPSKTRSRSKSKHRRRHSSSRSRSNSSSRRSHRSGSEDERRGQFTVADRKRYWKLHKSRQEERGDSKVVNEPKPPPGAVETTNADDITYGDPPEVVGPNFAELPLSNEDYYKASSSKKVLPIKNDGSFLEMFKKMQEVTKKEEEEAKKCEVKKPTLPFIGKRRGGRVLKTGVVKKAKAIDEQPADSTKDAWSLYMQEVKKYKETSCEDERKTRLLVK